MENITNQIKLANISPAVGTQISQSTAEIAGQGVGVTVAIGAAAQSIKIYHDRNAGGPINDLESLEKSNRTTRRNSEETWNNNSVSQNIVENPASSSAEVERPANAEVRVGVGVENPASSSSSAEAERPANGGDVSTNSGQNNETEIPPGNPAGNSTGKKETIVEMLEKVTDL